MFCSFCNQNVFYVSSCAQKYGKEMERDKIKSVSDLHQLQFLVPVLAGDCICFEYLSFVFCYIITNIDVITVFVMSLLCSVILLNNFILLFKEL